MGKSTLRRHVAMVMKMMFACGNGDVPDTQAIANACMTHLRNANIGGAPKDDLEAEMINAACNMMALVTKKDDGTRAAFNRLSGKAQATVDSIVTALIYARIAAMHMARDSTRRRLLGEVAKHQRHRRHAS
jgi:hypothetical protein